VQLSVRQREFLDALSQTGSLPPEKLQSCQRTLLEPLFRHCPHGRAGSLRQILACSLMKVRHNTLERNYKFTAQAFRREGQQRLAAQFSGDAAFNELGAKSPLVRLGNRGSALFKSLNA